MSKRFVTLLLETIEHMIMSPENSTKGIFSTRHKELLLFDGSKRPSIPFEKGIHQIGAMDPRPIGIPAEIGNAHVPTGKLKVDDAGPGSLLVDKPIGCTVVSVTGHRMLAFKR
jgi:hypothetical protein